MEHTIRRRLAEIEREENIFICLAVESGSRAWGFPSRDSDYDVRFLYLRQPAWYVSIDLEEQRDVIEYPIDELLDINGWDLRKALKLFRKSNPPLLEWLQCSLIYVEKSHIASQLRELIPELYSQRASFYHYLHMAQGNFREYLKGEVVWLKKYLYALRPLMAVRWIEMGLGAAPIEFNRLVDAVITDNGLREAIRRLVEEKMAGEELRRGPRIEVISKFIESELDRHTSARMEKSHPKTPAAPLDRVFREALREVWGFPGADVTYSLNNSII